MGDGFGLGDGDGVTAAATTGEGEGLCATSAVDGPVPWPDPAVLGAGYATVVVTNIASTSAVQAPAAATRLADRKRGIFVRNPKPFVASRTAARLSSPRIPKALFVGVWTSQVAISK